MGFLPLVRLADVIPSTCIASSSWAKRSAPRDRSNLAALVSLPWTVCALAMRCLPSADLGPVLCPPWCPHFCVLLDLRAGRPHCCFVRDDLAVQRRHLMRPAAVVRNLVVSHSVIVLLFHIMKNCDLNCLGNTKRSLGQLLKELQQMDRLLWRFGSVLLTSMVVLAHGLGMWSRSIVE